MNPRNPVPSPENQEILKAHKEALIEDRIMQHKADNPEAAVAGFNEAAASNKKKEDEVSRQRRIEERKKSEEVAQLDIEASDAIYGTRDRKIAVKNPGGKGTHKRVVKGKAGKIDHIKEDKIYGNGQNERNEKAREYTNQIEELFEEFGGRDGDGSLAKAKLAIDLREEAWSDTEEAEAKILEKTHHLIEHGADPNGSEDQASPRERAITFVDKKMKDSESQVSDEVRLHIIKNLGENGVFTREDYEKAKNEYVEQGGDLKKLAIEEPEPEPIPPTPEPSPEPKAKLDLEPPTAVVEPKKNIEDSARAAFYIEDPDDVIKQSKDILKRRTSNPDEKADARQKLAEAQKTKDEMGHEALERLKDEMGEEAFEEKKDKMGYEAMVEKALQPLKDEMGYEAFKDLKDKMGGEEAVIEKALEPMKSKMSKKDFDDLKDKMGEEAMIEEAFKDLKVHNSEGLALLRDLGEALNDYAQLLAKFEIKTPRRKKDIAKDRQELEMARKRYESFRKQANIRTSKFLQNNGFSPEEITEEIVGQDIGEYMPSSNGAAVDDRLEEVSRGESGLVRDVVSQEKDLVRDTIRQEKEKKAGGFIKRIIGRNKAGYRLGREWNGGMPVTMPGDAFLTTKVIEERHQQDRRDSQPAQTKQPGHGAKSKQAKSPVYASQSDKYFRKRGDNLIETSKDEGQIYYGIQDITSARLRDAIEDAIENTGKSKKKS